MKIQTGIIRVSNNRNCTGHPHLAWEIPTPKNSTTKNKLYVVYGIIQITTHAYGVQYGNTFYTPVRIVLRCAIRNDRYAFTMHLY